jgi:hypothetical protein
MKMAKTWHQKTSAKAAWQWRGGWRRKRRKASSMAGMAVKEGKRHGELAASKSEKRMA